VAPDVFVSLVGRFRSRGGYQRRFYCTQTLLHLFERGSGIVDADGRAHAVDAGDIYVFWPGQTVLYHDNPGAAWAYRWLNLKGERAAWALGRVGLARTSAR